MAWDIVREEEEKCPCGKGTYTIIVEKDDWNRRDEKWYMNCEECKPLYRYVEEEVRGNTFNYWKKEKER